MEGNKTWGLTKYFWASVIHDLQKGVIPPRIEFYADGVRFAMLRIDPENQRKFLLTQYMEVIPRSEEDDDPVPSKYTHLGFNMLLDDDENDDQCVYGMEIDGNPGGITQAIDVAIGIQGTCETDQSQPNNIQSAILIRWNSVNNTFEGDRRYPDILKEKGESMHVKGQCHDTTLVYCVVGKYVSLLVRAIQVKVQSVV